MILFRLADPDADSYAALHPRFAAALAWLRTHDLQRLPAGTHAICEGVRAIVSDDPGRGRKVARLEHHEQHIDLQVAVRGHDEVGWRPRSELKLPASDLDRTADVQKWFDEPVCWLPLPEGYVMVLFPADGHAPLAGLGELRKVVVKVAV